MTRYAMVPSQGLYSQGSSVRALSVHRTLRAALAAARRGTRLLRAAMAPHGGTSGFYRVVTTEALTRRTARWRFGHDLDREPSVSA